MDEEDYQRRNIYDDLNELLDADDKELAASQSPTKKNVKFGDLTGSAGKPNTQSKGNTNLNIDIDKVKEQQQARESSAQNAGDGGNPDTSTAKKKKKRNKRKKNKQNATNEKDTQNGDEEPMSGRQVGPIVMEDSESLGSLRGHIPEMAGQL